MAGSHVPQFTVRRMLPDDIPQVNEVWSETGLSEGVHTVDLWSQVDPEGFYVAATDEGEVLAVCAAILQHDNFAFVGMYAVREKYRRRGIGPKVWAAAMDHVGSRNTGVNAVPDQLYTYRDKAGFPLVMDWSSIPFRSTAPNFNVLTSELPGVEVVPISEDLLDDVIEYDKSIHGYCRSRIVKLSLKEEDIVALTAVSDGKVRGYGILKEDVQGTALVGPLYADQRDVAELILSRLVQEFPIAQKYGLVLMVLDKNQEAMDLASNLGLEPGMKVPRCYRTEEVGATFKKIFGQHDLNFSAF